ncbi:MAG: type III pantothenate kinase [Gemmiger sp.]|nr:type III pantothenate kinase [Gemmiger sp.]
MLLAFNIGNSNLTFGGYTPDGKLIFSAKIYADPVASADELTYKIINMLALYGADPLSIRWVIMASVVPALTPRLREAVGRMTQAPVMTVGPGLKSGVRIRLDNPAQLGGELLCAVVAALKHTSPPLIVLNMDTATTLLAVDESGSLLGGAILPGPQLSLAALVKNTAQLPQVELEAAPKALLGANTSDCLHSGIVNGTAAMLDGMVGRFRRALHCPDAPVIATGTLPESVRQACGCAVEYRETLILDGLYAIWLRNVKR